ncbi:hypothetical protein FACS189465_3140 [Clostridia bacterium]|nr:hypothetical protein FACS189465_3140 [Clostridia bacterium]
MIKKKFILSVGLACSIFMNLKTNAVKVIPSDKYVKGLKDFIWSLEKSDGSLRSRDVLYEFDFNETGKEPKLEMFVSSLDNFFDFGAFSRLITKYIAILGNCSTEVEENKSKSNSDLGIANGTDTFSRGIVGALRNVERSDTARKVLKLGEANFQKSDLIFSGIEIVGGAVTLVTSIKSLVEIGKSYKKEKEAKKISENLKNLFMECVNSISYFEYEGNNLVLFGVAKEYTKNVNTFFRFINITEDQTILNACPLYDVRHLDRIILFLQNLDGNFGIISVPRYLFSMLEEKKVYPGTPRMIEES